MKIEVSRYKGKVSDKKYIAMLEAEIGFNKTVISIREEHPLIIADPIIEGAKAMFTMFVDNLAMEKEK